MNFIDNLPIFTCIFPKPHPISSSVWRHLPLTVANSLLPTVLCWLCFICQSANVLGKLRRYSTSTRCEYPNPCTAIRSQTRASRLVAPQISRQLLTRQDKWGSGAVAQKKKYIKNILSDKITEQRQRQKTVHCRLQTEERRLRSGGLSLQ